MSKKANTVKTLTTEQAATPITATTPAVIANAMADHHVTTVKTPANAPLEPEFLAMSDAIKENPKITVDELKKVKAKAMAPDIDAHLDEMLEEIKEQTAPTIKAPKAKTPKTPKEPKATVPKNAIKYDLPAIIAALPDPITPAVLDKGFGLNDGGKTVRRHLRNHFADKMAHNKKDKWEFDKSTSTDVIEYFASRYAFDAAALATIKGDKA